VGKNLSEMTLEELWELFPIILTEYNPSWAEWYSEEEKFLKSILPLDAKINHIGSTAIKNIWAKPIVDIMIEMPKETDFEQIKSIMYDNGYRCMCEEEKRISFNKGYTENGFAEKVFHLHFRYYDDNDEIYFRDYLIKNPDVAMEYEALKLLLWKAFEHDRDGYTSAKTDFVKTYTLIAKTGK